jgi:hypothetical protein
MGRHDVGANLWALRKIVLVFSQPYSDAELEQPNNDIDRDQPTKQDAESGKYCNDPSQLIGMPRSPNHRHSIHSEE